MSFHNTYDFIIFSVNDKFVVIFGGVGLEIHIVADVVTKGGAASGSVPTNLWVVDEVGFSDV